LEWGLLAGADVARADAALASLEMPGVIVQRAVADSGGYWVYLPPMKSKAEVDKRIAALRARGVKDFYVVQDAGQWRNAISLGIFKSEETARNMAAKLKDSGVQGVALERRENMLKQIAYFIREPHPAAVARLAEIAREFPGTDVKAVPCPPAEKNAG
ncbi:MAG TPA: SPOR domain-containing protein, partial [Burkholderiales bacterium]|nr:SPOR domain-containing protein [Burkholderiales bacterium]